jgi:hypothetical protein
MTLFPRDSTINLRPTGAWEVMYMSTLIVIKPY